jgi:hypothetical protein
MMYVIIVESLGIVRGSVLRGLWGRRRDRVFQYRVSNNLRPWTGRVDLPSLGLVPFEADLEYKEVEFKGEFSV